MANEKKAAATAVDKGPDNNKRLAELEAGVSALAVALAANGIEVGVVGDPFTAAIAAVKSKAADVETIDQLRRSYAKLEETAKTVAEANDVLSMAVSAAPSMLATALGAAGVVLAEGADPVLVAIELISNGPNGGSASVGELAAIARAEAAEKALGEVNIELAGAIEDRDLAVSAKNELAQVIADKGYKQPEPGGAVDTQPEPEPEPRQRPEGARDFGPIYGDTDNALLAELIADSAGFEIAFSNGEHELVIPGLPVAIGAADFSTSGGRRMVEKAILVKGGDYREEIHGAALLHDGEQIHYCAFPAPVALEPGQERQFVKAIFFD